MTFFINKKFIILSLFFLFFLKKTIYSSGNNERGFEIFGGKKEGSMFTGKHLNYEKAINDSKDVSEKLEVIKNNIELITEEVFNKDLENSFQEESLVIKFNKKYEKLENKEYNITLKINPIINYNIFTNKKYYIDNVNYSLFELFDLSKNKNKDEKNDKNFIENFNKILNSIEIGIKNILIEIRNINIENINEDLLKIKEYDQKFEKEENFKKEIQKWKQYIEQKINENEIYKKFKEELNILENELPKNKNYFYYLNQLEFFKNKDLNAILKDNYDPIIFYEKNKEIINNTYNEGNIIKGFLFEFIISTIIINIIRKEMSNFKKKTDQIKKEIENILIDNFQKNNEENNNFIRELISKKVDNYINFIKEQNKPKKEIKKEEKEEINNKIQQEQKLEKEQNEIEKININKDQTQEKIIILENDKKKEETTEKKTEIKEAKKQNQIINNSQKTNLITIKDLQLPSEEKEDEKVTQENIKDEKKQEQSNLDSSLKEKIETKTNYKENIEKIKNEMLELENFLNKQISELADHGQIIDQYAKNNSIEELELMIKNNENNYEQINNLKETIEKITKSNEYNKIENKNIIEKLNLDINKYLLINKNNENENENYLKLIAQYKENLNEITNLIKI
jgi:hypothetical protein